MSLEKEISKLNAEYRKATGEDMPYEFGSLSLPQMRRAVKLVQEGNTVFVPKDFAVERNRDEDAVSSLMDWDAHGAL